ncbi:phospholipid-binding protein [Mesorhizobium sp. SP-1A]|uniref:phospholipid-binding protein n=1 Tax=Mesorhizobium sp. SP-1A TaxID=3077840 RepID=UPI0028F72B53|nr:phospholipid-binding protein [Mesorhizobium sp. SP-1A]
MRAMFAIFAFLAMTGTAHAAMNVSFDWGPTKKCFDDKSPPMKITGVPAGTKMLDVVMVDRDAPDFHHGGGKVAYQGQSLLPYGAFRYKGPCPPAPHRYRFTVKALDVAGKVLATASAEKRFP